MNWAWKLRGLLDKMVGAVGLRRGRTHPDKLQVGEALDFWRVLHADPKKGRLLLYAEMRLPGEAWLEFKISKLGEKKALVQTASGAGPDKAASTGNPEIIGSDRPGRKQRGGCGCQA